MVRHHLDDALTQETLPAVDGRMSNNIIDTLLCQCLADIATSSQPVQLHYPPKPHKTKHIHKCTCYIIYIARCLDRCYICLLILCHNYYTYLTYLLSGLP